MNTLQKATTHHTRAPSDALHKAVIGHAEVAPAPPPAAPASLADMLGELEQMNACAAETLRCLCELIERFTGREAAWSEKVPEATSGIVPQMAQLTGRLNGRLAEIDRLISQLGGPIG